MHTPKLIRRILAAAGLSLALAALLAASPAHAATPGSNGKIIFVANTSGSWQIYAINPDGTNMTQLTHLPTTHFELWVPNFSPDGQHIVFVYGPDSAGGLGDVYVANADGSGVVPVTHDALNLFAHWAPDGNHIIFGKLSLLTGQLVITTMRADGSDVVSLTNQFELGNYGGIYTPDGKQIGFGSSIGGLVTAAWIMDADGQNQKRLTGPGIEASAVWDISPDGQKIVFWSHNTGHLPYAVYTMNLDGSGLKQLTHSGFGHDLQPSFSPDGSKIVFVSDRFSTNSSLDLFVMNTDGSDATRIATGLTRGGCTDFNCVGPSWGPDVPASSGIARKPIANDLGDDVMPSYRGGNQGYCSLDPQNRLTGTCIGNGGQSCVLKSDTAHCPTGRQAISPTNYSCQVKQVARVDASRICTD